MEDGGKEEENRGDYLARLEDVVRKGVTDLWDHEGA